MDNRTEIKKGSIIVAASEDGSRSVFKIDSLIGRGGSSLVYNAEYNGEKGRLKEFFPSDLNIERADDGISVIIHRTDEKADKLYKESLCRFENSMKIRSELRAKSEIIRNTMPEFCQIFSGNNTKYIFQSYTGGYCFSEHPCNESLKDILAEVLAVAKTVKCYHDIGYVHLDIKPQNVYIALDAANGITVKLFDFDTVRSVSQLKSSEISYSDNYSSPEQRNGRVNKIGFCSDIYSIGMILFERIMRRFPDDSKGEGRFGARYNDLDVPPQLKEIISFIFSRTIAYSTETRFSNIDELISALQKAVNLSEHKLSICQKNNYYVKNGIFVGRSTEIEQFKNVLERNGIAVLHGMGGIGKTEFVKHFIGRNKSEYGVVIYIPETGRSIMNAIVDDNNIEFKGLIRQKNTSDNEYFNNKRECIIQECREAAGNCQKLLIVFDNTEETADLSTAKYFSDLGCQVVIVSRYRFEEYRSIPKFELSAISDENELVRMFSSVCDDDDEKVVDHIKQIIHRFNGHTLVLELIANAMKINWLSPEEILERLDKYGITCPELGSIPYEYNNALIDDSIDNILFSILKINDVSDEEITIMQFLALVPSYGINTELFKEFLKLKDHRAVYRLGSTGIINSDKFISIHPLIKEMILAHYPITPELGESIIHTIIDRNHMRKEIKKKSSAYMYADIGYNLSAQYSSNNEEFYSATAELCRFTNRFTDAESMMEKAIEIIENKMNIDDNSVYPRAGIILMRYGRMLIHRNKFDEAERILKRSVYAYSRIKPADFSDIIKTNQSKTYNQIARLYYNMGSYYEAFKYAKLAETICLGIGEPSVKTITYIKDTIGCILYAVGLYEPSYKYFHDSYSLKEEMYGQDNSSLMYSYEYMAECKMKMNELAEADENIDNAVAFADNSEGTNAPRSAEIYVLAAEIKSLLGQTESAAVLINKACSWMENTKADNEIFGLLCLALNLQILWGEEDSYIFLSEKVKKAFLYEKYEYCPTAIQLYGIMSKLENEFDPDDRYWRNKYSESERVKKEYAYMISSHLDFIAL